MIATLIKRIAQYLDRSRIPYMIIGGQAVLLYGTPRLTRDIDITLGVDFIFSFTPYEAQTIERAREVPMEGYPVRFAACEDVIIHKMVAARAIDLEDVRHILAKNKEQIDFDYVRQWLLEFGKLPGYERILTDFEGLLNGRSDSKMDMD